MAADYADIIKGAMDVANIGGEDEGDIVEVNADDDAVSTEPADTGTGGEVTGSEEMGGDPAALQPEKSEPVIDELTQELEALGLKAPKTGERENRLPYSRVKKIVENARKKLAEQHTAALTEHTTKLTAAEQRAQLADNWDRMIESDPERTIRTLAVLHPEKYGKYVSEHITATPVVQQPAVAAVNDPKPSPDAEYSDGSKGYSPEGLDALLAWTTRQAVRQAVADTEKQYTERFGPIEQQWKSQQLVAERLPGIRAQIAAAGKTWGKAFEDDYKLDTKSEVLQYLQANPSVSFEAGVAAVMVPKLQASRDTMRSDILKEINARPKAAVKTVPGGVKADIGSTGNRSLEDIIKESIDAAGIR